MDDAKLWIIGDPMADVYHQGDWQGRRFVPQRTIRRPGAAANVYANAEAICSDLKDEQTIGVYTGWDPRDYQRWMLELIRMVHPDGEVLELYGEAQASREIHYSYRNGIQYLDESIFWKKKNEFFFGPQALIISDYNRGMVNQKRLDFGRSLPLKKLPRFVVVDSRYRSTDLTLIKGIPVKIWRCSGEECDAEWAKNFDWVVTTSHGGTMFIENIKTGDVQLMEPNRPDKVVDDCGAGDTFTAALGAHLLKQLQDTEQAVIDEDAMIGAVDFASLCASDVVQKNYTAVTDIRL